MCRDGRRACAGRRFRLLASWTRIREPGHASRDGGGDGRVEPQLASASPWRIPDGDDLLRERGGLRSAAIRWAFSAAKAAARSRSWLCGSHPLRGCYASPSVVGKHPSFDRFCCPEATTREQSAHPVFVSLMPMQFEARLCCALDVPSSGEHVGLDQPRSPPSRLWSGPFSLNNVGADVCEGVAALRLLVRRTFYFDSSTTLLSPAPESKTSTKRIGCAFLIALAACSAAALVS